MLRYDRKFVKAEGVKLVDDAEKEYLDFLAGYGALNLGHNHPGLIEACRTYYRLQWRILPHLWLKTWQR